MQQVSLLVLQNDVQNKMLGSMCIQWYKCKQGQV